ncbi:unnamed protein product [Vitrella brassicaformis CCMP3155]|uniref:Uncharacterized protein n=2 Tax=Vitrella brassicaformis TaxID=1169539 RepID=A0A0G4FR31_VITBC|nr:unnamed protein product [Vitrella brassicaformis CCMP3155]|eukprot:CEM16915.1 unnamed protein product [Vitrella brassicaformis CCMP3155]
MSLFERETPSTIEYLWLEQFKDKPRVLTDVLQPDEYDTLTKNASHAPMFIAPLTKSPHHDMKGNGIEAAKVQLQGTQGFRTLVLQFQDKKHILYTSLEEFQRDAQAASPHLIVTVFDDLLASKQLALLRVDILAADIDRLQAKRVLDYTRRFYTDGALFRWVESFNHRARGFDFAGFTGSFPDHWPRKG